MKDPICPFAVQAILHGEEDRRPTINPIATALHIAVTTAAGDALQRYFDQESVKDDSTFYVDLLGGLWQFGPVNRKANAQFGGNSICVSIETAGMGGPLNAAQIATLKRLYAWLFTDWGISLDVSTRDDGPGAGWHSKYPRWNKNAHACPNDERVEQLKTIILPGAKLLVAGPAPILVPPSVHEEHDMPAKFIASVPFAPGKPGSDPYFVVCEQEKATEVAVASVNGAPFNPPFKVGKHDGVEDFIFLDLWWRRFTTPGKPTGVVERSDRVDFTCEGTPGTYIIASK